MRAERGDTGELAAHLSWKSAPAALRGHRVRRLRSGRLWRRGHSSLRIFNCRVETGEASVAAVFVAREAHEVPGRLREAAQAPGATAGAWGLPLAAGPYLDIITVAVYKDRQAQNVRPHPSPDTDPAPGPAVHSR